VVSALTPTTPRPPTAGLLAAVVTSTWIDRTPHGDAAFLLVAHPPDRRAAFASVDTVAPQMRGLGEALGLAVAAERLPFIGHRVTVHGDKAAVRVDGCDYSLGATVGPRWGRFVADGGPIVIALGLDPLSHGADRATIEAYLGRCTLAGRLLLGITGHQGTGGVS
jgi:hypothetical protein